MLTATLTMPGLADKLAAWKAAALAGLQESVPAGASLIVSEAQILVPVDTGNLRDHIHSEELTSTPTRVVHQIAPFVESSNEYGFDPAYARRIEYGFFGADRMGRNYHQAGQPYMRPAKEVQGEAALTTIKHGVLDPMRSV
jgi:hypothetical protein